MEFCGELSMEVLLKTKGTVWMENGDLLPDDFLVSGWRRVLSVLNTVRLHN